MTDARVAPGVATVLERLAREDVIGQLIDRRGRMAVLATEAGSIKLDWVDGLARVTEGPDGLANLEGYAADVLGGADQLVWSGMGGSIMAVRSMLALGMPARTQVEMRPLDSTDPRALNEIFDTLSDGASLIAVSMGLTSEEPLSHVRWFDGLEPGVRRRSVMTIPGSVLDEFADSRNLPRIPLQPDGGDGTPGRMSAPGTHVFQLPALLAAGSGSRLLTELVAAQDIHQVRGGLDAPERTGLIFRHPAARLAARIHAHLREGRNKALVVPGPGAGALSPWVEQLVEESLGKQGRGLLVFPDQSDSLLADPPDDCFLLGLHDALPADWSPTGVGAIAAFFAAWSLTVALLGYLEGITFVGQPAVEGYKRHARELRDAPGPLSLPDGIPVVDAAHQAIARLSKDPRAYLDVTLNAAASTPGWGVVTAAAKRFANGVLRRPVKVRIAPAHYHSTEQAQVDGPPDVHSLRVILKRTEAIRAGAYDLRYLHAQAIGAAVAMEEAGRPVSLITLEDADGLSELAAALT